MTIQKDEKLYQCYMEITESLRRTVHSREDAEMLFWVETYRMIAQSKLAEKCDILGIIMTHVTGSNARCSEIYHFNENQPEAYRQFTNRYRLSDALNELGTFWKQLFCRRHVVYLLSLRTWLEGYTKECMPSIYKMIHDLEREFDGDLWGQATKQYQRYRQAAYKAQRTQLRNLIAKIDVSRELSYLRQETPTYDHE